MKIIQINSECGRGSTGKIVVAISKLLNKRDIENYIFYSGNHKSDYPNGIMIASKLSIRIHQILSRIFGDQGFHSYFATKHLIKRIKKIEPDAILIHNIHGYYLHIGVLFEFLKQYNKPVFWTFHDCWVFTGHCTHFTIAMCDKWKEKCFECPQKKVYPYSWFWDRSEELYKKKRELFTAIEDLTIITPSEWLAQNVQSSFMNKYPIQVINNGINLDIFKPIKSDFREKYAIENKKIVLGVASVWSYAKGLDMFIELSKRLDCSQYQIVLVGTDDNIDRQIPNSIISIHRTQNQKELAEIYSAADVFVNPTREENYPTVNMEAIACGTPVVTFNTGGCVEIVNSDCGAIVYSNTIEELLEKVVYITQYHCQNRNKCMIYSKRFAEQLCFEKYIKLICS